MKSKNLISNFSRYIKSGFSKVFDFFKNFKSYSKKKKIIIILIIIFLLIAIIVGISKAKSKTAMAPAFIEATVEKRDITSSITGSAVVNPKDQYSITSLVSGDVLSANFEQGDVVKEGDILYEIDAEDAQNTIQNSDISYQRSQLDYNKAVKNYNDLNIKSTISGVVKQLYIKDGDTVNSGTKIAGLDNARLVNICVSSLYEDAMPIGRSPR
jgi:HlyD family secretion protein